MGLKVKVIPLHFLTFHNKTVSHICTMRVVKEIPHPELKITVFQWNNRYLIKFEAGLLEQTYKVQEYDIASEEQLLEIISPEFIKNVTAVFHSMHQHLHQAVAQSEA